MDHINTHDGLRSALDAIADEGWDGSVGLDVLAAVARRAPVWARATDRRCLRPTGTTVPDDVISTAWVTLSRFGDRIRSSEAPWAYLWTAVGNSLAVEIAGEVMLSQMGPRRGRAHFPASVDRAGLHLAESRRARALDDAELPPLRTGVTRLIGRLARDEEEHTFWWRAIDHALDVMADARRSYEDMRSAATPTFSTS